MSEATASARVRASEPARERRLLPGRAWQVAVLFGLLALAVSAIADLWQSPRREAAARADVRERLVPYGASLRAAVVRRLGLLTGFRSFAESRRTRADLDEEFTAFALGTLAGAEGVRVMQLVEDDRIVAIVPLELRATMLGFDLGATDPGNASQLRTGRPVVTGPIELREGGLGLLLRQQLPARPGFPDVVTIILDVPTLVREARIPDGRSGLRMELLRNGTTWFGGDPRGTTVRPETLSLFIENNRWQLLASPVVGWAALARGRAAQFRLAAAFVVALATMVGFLVGQREERLERELEASGTRLDLVLRAGRMAIWEWDLRSNRVHCSASIVGLLGFDPSTTPHPDRAFFSAVHPDDREMVTRTLEATRAGQRVSNVLECRVVHPDGTTRWILAISEAQRDETGTPVSIAGVLSDATERRELEEQLRHSQRLESIGKLAGGISHDFNNLLTAMIGFTELAVDQAGRLGDDPRAASIRADLGQVLSTANRAATLTGQLLAFSRRGVTRPEPLDVAAVVRDLEPMLRRLISAEITLTVTADAGLPRIMMDSGQLTQVILNLVVNARDAMPAGGELVIRTSLVAAEDQERPVGAPDGELVCLMVSDTGVGMSEEVRARVFEPYFTTKEMGRGTGLGLAVVYGAVHHARGAVTVSSEEGKGSVFRVYLSPHEPRDRPSPA